MALKLDTPLAAIPVTVPAAYIRISRVDVRVRKPAGEHVHEVDPAQPELGPQLVWKETSSGCTIQAQVSVYANEAQAHAFAPPLEERWVQLGDFDRARIYAGTPVAELYAALKLLPEFAGAEDV